MKVREKFNVITAGLTLLLSVSSFYAAGSVTTRQTNQGKNTQVTDIVILGDSSSEQAHQLVSVSSDIVTGGLNQAARRLLPLDPAGTYGGSLTFNLAVDPKRRNYISLKLWGEDGGNEHTGRIYLYILKNNQSYQVGYRHEGDYMPLNVTGWAQELPGRFFYSTTLLPLSMTRGETSVKLKLVSTGRLYGLGKNGPPDGNYQYAMDRPGRTIYRVYSHTDAYLDVSDEVQGQTPELKVKPESGEDVLAAGGSFRKRLNDWISQKTSESIDSLSVGDIAFLSKAYSVPETAAYHNQTVLKTVVDAIDSFATRYYADPDGVVSGGGNNGWGGQFGAIGKAIYYLKDELASSLDQTSTYGEGGTIKRREAWGEILFASREFGRLNRSGRSLSNQSFIANESVYMANKGLAVLEDSRAFTEAQAQRYLKEACGLQPWLGSDLEDGGHAKDFGSDYFQVTDKGQTREWGYVGNSYGEMAFHVAAWYEITGNEDFRKQAEKMLKARAPFRREAVEVKDDHFYRVMIGIGLLSWRGAQESDGELSNSLTYADRGQWSLGIHVPAVTKDKTLIAYAKQMLEDHQFFSSLLSDSRYAYTEEALDVFQDYQIVKQTEDTGERLPMTKGQPDFAWADEDNRVVAIKHGDDRLWVSAYWQAKKGTGINGIGRFLYTTPEYDQYGVLETVPQFQTQDWFVRPENRIDKPEHNQWVPENPPLQAYGGEILPLGSQPEDARSDAPFRGKADFYRFRFGHYLIGLNAHASKSFQLLPPNDLSSATDLFSGRSYSDTVTVAPKTTVALYLNAQADQTPLPGTPLWVQATATGSNVQVSWSAASGADHYTIERATTPDGNYTVVGSNLSQTEFKDTITDTDGHYYYRVKAQNNGGSGTPSMAAKLFSATLPEGWISTETGDSQSGQALYDKADKTFTVRGFGRDIGGQSDSFHFTAKQVNGDTSLVAKVTRRSSGSGTDKVGLMIREKLTSGSKAAVVMLSAGGNMVRFGNRGGDNWRMSYNDFPEVDGTTPKWLKIERKGNELTGYVSTDGTHWQYVNSTSIKMSSEAYIGLAVTSRSSELPVTARFQLN